MAVAALGLAGLNAALSLSNGDAAARVAQRRDFIAQTPQLARVVQLAASALAARNADPAIRELLDRAGIAPAPAAPR